jgi:hypothetical protein
MILSVFANRYSNTSEPLFDIATPLLFKILQCVTAIRYRYFFQKAASALHL